jgi:hypothetical protein
MILTAIMTTSFTVLVAPSSLKLAAPYEGFGGSGFGGSVEFLEEE